MLNFLVDCKNSSYLILIIYDSILKFNICDFFWSACGNDLKFDISDIISIFIDNEGGYSIGVGIEEDAPGENGPEGDGPNSGGNGPEDDGPEGDGPNPGENGPEGNGPEGDGPEGDGPDRKGESSSKGKGKAKATSPEPVTEEFKEAEDPTSNKESSGKGKGKARAITPEPVTEDYKEPSTDLDDDNFEADIEKAKSNSLKQTGIGESSKQGANLSLLDQQQKDLRHNEYYATREARLETVRAYNDIMDYIEKHGDTIDMKQKEYLLNESIRTRNLVDQYTTHAQNLKNELNIPSSEEEYSSEESSSGENKSGDSSDEDSKNGDRRTRDSSDDESRPSKRPRN